MPLELDPRLARRLHRLSVAIDVLDSHTLLLRRVPTNARFYNKPATNLLMKQPDNERAWLVCVDEDLEYRGSNRQLATAFAAAQTQNGWRALFLVAGAGHELSRVVDQALAALGSDGRRPELVVSPPTATAARTPTSSLLAATATNLTERVGEQEPTVGRDDELAALLTALLAWQPRVPIIVGRSGAGKTNLISGLARRLRQCRPAASVLRIDMGTLFAGTLLGSERDNLLDRLLEEAGSSPDVVLALEQLDLALSESNHGTSLLIRFVDRGGRLLGTCLPQRVRRFGRSPLARRCQLVALTEMDAATAVKVLERAREQIAARHRLDVDRSCAAAAVKAAATLPGLLPAKAIRLLDAAVTLARLRRAAVVGPDDIFSALSSMQEARRTLRDVTRS